MRNGRLLLQIRLSALVALTSALHLVLGVLLMIPVRSLLNLLLDGERHFGWRLPLIVGGGLGSILFMATFLSTLADLRKEDRIEVSRSPSFPARAFMSGLCALLTAFSLWGIAGFYLDREPLWLQMIPLGFLGLSFYAWPRTIHCSDTHVSQRSLFGWKKSIPYTSVEAISVDIIGTTTVLGAGTTVEHTSYHIHAEAFRDLVSRLSGKPVY